MDAFDLCLAVGPLAMYLLALGVINLGRRPVVTTGAREIMALALALGGFVLVGPMQLFFPEAAASRFGPWVWWLLSTFYVMCVTLWIITSRPRLVIYNIVPEYLREILNRLAPTLDPQAHWAGDNLMMPQRGVQLHIEGVDRMRNIVLVALGTEQSHSGWRELENALIKTLRETPVERNPRGFSFLSAGVLLLTAMLYKTLQDPQAVADGLLEMLRR